jgi:hypothetical protein
VAFEDGVFRRVQNGSEKVWVPFSFQKWLCRLDSIAAVIAFLTLIALSLIRIGLDGTPWHLATGKYAFENWHWPTENTFAYTHSEYPLYQQYPAYQTILFCVFRLFGWNGLSVLHSFFWIGIFIIWVKWSGSSIRKAKSFVLAWTLCLLCMQRRMILRPEILSTLLLMSILLLFDIYKKKPLYIALCLVIIQIIFANSHQLFFIGIAFQLIFIFHLFLTQKLARYHRIYKSDISTPITPAALAFIFSIIACLATPLGKDIVSAALRTMGSLKNFNVHVAELAPFYSDNYTLTLFLCSTALAVIAFYKCRNTIEPFHVGLWIIAFALLNAGKRSIALYSLISIGLFCRSFRQGARNRNYEEDSPTGRFVFKTTCALLSIVICCGVIYLRLVEPNRILGGIQSGVGLALGEWPIETIRFIRQNPPPGNMINLSWYSGNALIELFPEKQIFIDGRFEAYPVDFILKTIEAETNRKAMDELIDEYQPGWMVLETKNSSLRKIAVDLIAENKWQLVNANTILLTLVRTQPENLIYIGAHRLNPEEIYPKDLLDTEPDLKALQQITMAYLFFDFGINTKMWEMIRSAEAVSNSYPEVRKALSSFKIYINANYPGQP